LELNFHFLSLAVVSPVKFVFYVKVNQFKVIRDPSRIIGGVMKKLFLTVSAFTVALSAVSAANAEPPKKACPVPVHHKAPQPKKEVIAKPAQSKRLGLEISGETSANYYWFENKQREPDKGKGRGSHLAVDDSRINFEVFGKASECLGGLEYSFLIGMSGNAETGNNPIEENRIKLKGEWGTFLAGDTRGVTDFMAVGTFYFLGATGGILGNYKAVINETSGIVIRDDLLNRFTPKDQTKVIYVTPRIYGVQLGYSYTPDGSHKGDQHLHSHTPTSSGYKSVNSGVRFAGVSFNEFAVNYKDSYLTCVDVSMSATGIIGEMRDLRRTLQGNANVNQAYYPWNRRHMKAFALGAVVEYAGFSLGGEYLNNLKSGELKVLKGSNLGQVYTIGIGYKKDENEMSLAYLHSKRKLGRLEVGPLAGMNFGNVKADNFSLTFDHEIAPGLVAYAEGIAFKMHASQPGTLTTWNSTVNGFSTDHNVGPNRGQVLITGARIKF
jgi:hypothetical protein